jgi:hypothetical protein
VHADLGLCGAFGHKLEYRYHFLGRASADSASS